MGITAGVINGRWWGVNLSTWEKSNLFYKFIYLEEFLIDVVLFSLRFLSFVQCHLSRILNFIDGPTGATYEITRRSKGDFNSISFHNGADSLFPRQQRRSKSATSQFIPLSLFFWSPVDWKQLQRQVTSQVKSSPFNFIYSTAITSYHFEFSFSPFQSRPYNLHHSSKKPWKLQ